MQGTALDFFSTVSVIDTVYHKFLPNMLKAVVDIFGSALNYFFPICLIGLSLLGQTSFSLSLPF